MDRALAVQTIQENLAPMSPFDEIEIPRPTTPCDICIRDTGCRTGGVFNDCVCVAIFCRHRMAGGVLILRPADSPLWRCWSPISSETFEHALEGLQETVKQMDAATGEQKH